eukprot:TRINITY_DN52_c0_g1_i1.p1 TRINITY_DN52_c0_g1~~TRINITY_DN52_c0_g1_i1.p1  ORF type:complete len:272 (+),score=48.83 TRINITY_DN52_c0_g1_i1:97-912(+)
MNTPTDIKKLKNKSKPVTNNLSTTTQYILIALIIVLGIIPSLAFFDFVLYNAEYTSFFPLVTISSSNVVKVIFNFVLYGAFGFFHSLLAQATPQAELRTHFPSQTIRGIYIIGTGLSLSVVMALWQPITPGDINLWTPLLDPVSNQKLAVILFWGFMVAGLVHIWHFFGLGGFVGFNQLQATEVKRTQGTPKLITTGLYGVTRHPIYLMTFCAYVVSPTFLNWNRILHTVVMAVYLFFAIPVEERKASAIFGGAYDEYKRRIPTIIPQFWK